MINFVQRRPILYEVLLSPVGWLKQKPARDPWLNCRYAKSGDLLVPTSSGLNVTVSLTGATTPVFQFSTGYIDEYALELMGNLFHLPFFTTDHLERNSVRLYFRSHTTRIYFRWKWRGIFLASSFRRRLHKNSGKIMVIILMYLSHCIPILFTQADPLTLDEATR